MTDVLPAAFAESIETSYVIPESVGSTVVTARAPAPPPLPALLAPFAPEPLATKTARNPLAIVIWFESGGLEGVKKYRPGALIVVAISDLLD
jgi:hypothetical protein